jgi:hypothetical protein
MCNVGGEVEVRLKTPSIVRLEAIEERGCHSSGHVSEPGGMDGIRREKDAEEYGRLTVWVRAKSESNFTNFARVKRLSGLGDGLL